MRLAQSPKHQLADPAFAAHLLGATASGLLSNQVGAVGRSSAASSRLVRDGLLLGALFESLVTQSVRSYAQRSLARVHHLRTARGGRPSGDREIPDAAALVTGHTRSTAQHRGRGHGSEGFTQSGPMGRRGLRPRQTLATARPIAGCPAEAPDEWRRPNSEQRTTGTRSREWVKPSITIQVHTVTVPTQTRTVPPPTVPPERSSGP